MIDAILAFGLALAIDLVYTKWQLAVTANRRLSASLYSAACPLLGSLSLIVFLDDRWTLLPSAIGHGLGTFFALTYGPDSRSSQDVRDSGQVGRGPERPADDTARADERGRDAEVQDRPFPPRIYREDDGSD